MELPGFGVFFKFIYLITPFLSLSYKTLIHEEKLWEDTSDDHEVSVKFLSSRRNFLPKKRQAETASLAPWLGPCTHVGIRKIV